MWILILTIVSQSAYGGQALAAVPGFTAEAVCLSAATTWLKSTNESGKYPYRTAICVKA